MSETYKLTYFNARGRAEPMRLIFAYGKTQFEDNRISHADWPELKKQMPWGHMPILEVSAGIISESHAIIRYLAKKFDLYGKNDFEAAKCDEYGYVLEDLIGEMYKFIKAKDAGQKAEVKTALISTHLPFYFNKLEKIQRSNGGPYLLGERVTFADIMLANILEALENALDSQVLDPYGVMKGIQAAVFRLPGIQEYVAKRLPPP